MRVPRPAATRASSAGRSAPTTGSAPSRCSGTSTGRSPKPAAHHRRIHVGRWYELLVPEGRHERRYLNEHGVTIWTNGAPTATSARSTGTSGGRGRPPTPDHRPLGRIVDTIAPIPPATPRRQRVERRRPRPHGPPALPASSVLRVGRRPAVVPALPAQRRRLPRRAVQPASLVAHRARQGHRPRTGRVRPRSATHLYLNHLDQALEQLSRARAAPSPRARRHHRPRRRRRTDPGARLPPQPPSAHPSRCDLRPLPHRPGRPRGGTRPHRVIGMQAASSTCPTTSVASRRSRAVTRW